MAEKRTRERGRTGRRTETQKTLGWAEYKILIQLLTCIALVVAFVLTQGMTIRENVTVRDYVKTQLTETTNVKEAMTRIRQLVDAGKQKTEKGAESAPVSAPLQPTPTPMPTVALPPTQ